MPVTCTSRLPLLSKPIPHNKLATARNSTCQTSKLPTLLISTGKNCHTASALNSPPTLSSLKETNRSAVGACCSSLAKTPWARDRYCVFWAGTGRVGPCEVKRNHARSPRPYKDSTFALGATLGLNTPTITILFVHMWWGNKPPGEPEKIFWILYSVSNWMELCGWSEVMFFVLFCFVFASWIIPPLFFSFCFTTFVSLFLTETMHCMHALCYYFVCVYMMGSVGYDMRSCRW